METMIEQTTIPVEQENRTISHYEYRQMHSRIGNQRKQLDWLNKAHSKVREMAFKETREVQRKNKNLRELNAQQGHTIIYLKGLLAEHGIEYKSIR